MVKKTLFSLLVSASLFLTGCGTGSSLLGNIFGGGTTTTNTTSNVLGSVLGSVLGNTSGNILGGILGGSLLTDNTTTSLVDMVIGNTKLNQSELVGTWVYAQPGCAFTSQNLLAKAGGAVAADQAKQKLSSAYNSIGFASNNTGFAFDQKGNFEAVLKGLPLSGTYTFDPSTGKLNLKTSVITIPAYVTRTTNGLSITMESKMLMNIIQAMSTASGNSAISAIGNLSKQFDGVRLGFDVVQVKQ